MPYYNTTKVAGAELKRYQKNASSQDDIILNYFKNNKGKKIGSSDVWKAIFRRNNVPITSVRRSIHTLFFKKQKLVFVSKKRGFYGRPECEYIYKQTK